MEKSRLQLTGKGLVIHADAAAVEGVVLKGLFPPQLTRSRFLLLTSPSFSLFWICFCLELPHCLSLCMHSISHSLYVNRFLRFLSYSLLRSCFLRFITFSPSGCLPVFFNKIFLSSANQNRWTELLGSNADFIHSLRTDFPLAIGSMVKSYMFCEVPSKTRVQQPGV